MRALFNAVTFCALFISGVASAENPSINPAGSVGETHNVYLECLSKVAPEGTRDEMLQAVVKDCGYEPGVSFEEFVKQADALLPREYTDSLTEMVGPHRARYSDKQFAYMLQAERILQTQSPEEAAGSLAKLEEDAVRNLGREQSDLEVLGGLSTARHSTYYWTVLHPDQVPARARWWPIVLADVVGTLVGGPVVGSVASAVAAVLTRF
jgi:hypothetical protein